MTYVQEKKQLQQMADYLCKCTKFKKSDVEHLQAYYTERFGKGKLDRSKFRDFLVTLGLTDDTIMDRVFKVFDANNDGHVCMQEWIKGLAIWLRGSYEDQVSYTFKIYDMNGDGLIGRDDVFNILKKAIIKPQADEDPEEGVRDLVEMGLKRLSSNQNTMSICKEDFEKACEADTLHVELLGQCIPPRAKIEDLQMEAFCH